MIWILLGSIGLIALSEKFWERYGPRLKQWHRGVRVRKGSE